MSDLGLSGRGNVGGGRQNGCMNPLLDQLQALDAAAAGMVDGDPLGQAYDEELLMILSVAARVQRRVEAVMIDAVGDIACRSATAIVAERMTSRFGCHDVNELVQRATLLAPVTASRMIRASKAVCGERALVSRERLEPPMPALRAAMVAGAIGVDGVVAASTDVLAAKSRLTREERDAADAALAAAATGDGADGSPPACADLLRVQAQTWVAVLDQDGAEPRERLMAHKRSFVIGTPGAYGVPVRGMLMPEVAAQWQHLVDAALSPRVTFDDPAALASEGPIDSRTRAQKQHDLFATVLGVAAASRELPTIGGAAPTLVVSVRAEDLAGDTGTANLDASHTPVSLAFARHVACSGVIQRITLDATGRIHRIGTQERVFNRHQRRAIVLRDGGCIIPGCTIPAAWCEIHHVTEHAIGGPTHTDNGVLLCWHHHRFLDTSGWRIRMNHGTPEVKAPTWWDSSGRWRAVTKSPTRLRNTATRT